MKPDKNSFEIDGKSLTVERFIDIVYNGTEVRLTKKAEAAVKKCNNYLRQILESGETVYGINTGFGKLAKVRISDDKLEELQTNLILSHAVGVGEPLSEVETRGVMVLRANCLSQGNSGVRPVVITTLLDMLNKGVHPLIPSRGSVGASGDLAPLAHLALTLIGKGKAKYRGKIYRGGTALKKANITPLVLQPKEGLALINGTQVMTALGLISVAQAKRLAEWADLIGAAGTDAILGSAKIADSGISRLRPHKGQKESAERIRKYLIRSEINLSHRGCGKIQDNYSFRCMPQVHGAVRDAVAHVGKLLTIEANSVTDNPLIFPDKKKVISGGNFHGEPVALALDYLSMGVAELGNISERRTATLIDSSMSNLPAFLAVEGGLNSGFMMLQVTAAALVNESKVLSHPASVDSIPTSANQEDHVSMGVTSALKLKQITKNTAGILAIELLSSIQGIEFRRPLKSSRYIERMIQTVRKDKKIPFVKKDHEFHQYVQKLTELILNEDPPVN
ncbi:MAG: histidine ammonia-lyase [candidate division Zixibacteria bacterium]|nr:histidine ammonia-lyase [candidate division Zixibacteria bacterium]